MLRARHVGFLLAIAACGTTDRTFDPSGSATGDAPPPSSTAMPPGATPASTPPGNAPPSADPNDGCTAGDAICTSARSRRSCVAKGAGAVWVDEACAAGSGCYQGACTPNACSDECTLGQTQGGKTCAPIAIGSGAAATSDPQAKLHDRARGYLEWLGKAGMLAGSVGDAYFADPPAYTQVTRMDGIGDSALWTGTLLAAESLRLRATGAADARARVKSLFATVHLMMNVSGEPGMLVRYVKESGTTYPFAIPDLDCTNQRVHCDVDYAGKKYDFIGHISRDQYQGVILGMALAYEALGSADEDVREQIRGDVVTFVKELMKERALPLAITYNGVGLPVALVPIRFIVVDDREMTSGAANIQINSSGGDKVGSMFGFQEFIPNLQDVLKHVPGIGAIGGLVPLPRSSSAIMLASFFRVALRVTDNAPKWSKDRADILAFYTGHSGEGGDVDDWLAIAKQWTAGTDCGGSYYSNNITMMPLYDLARLEDDPARGPTVRDEIFTGKLWPAFAPTKNVFFSFLYAGSVSGTAPSIVTDAATQLAEFPAAPRVQVPVDLRGNGKYPAHDATCADQVAHSSAVDVGDRIPADFLWQRQPWGLFDYGDEHVTHPGVDFLVAYFLGRYHHFLTDDTAGTCLVWQ
jgi:hypothetical protein